ncbi:MAG: NAD-dependent formate dehydrogenase alpha subunit [uncultured Caballeronia sp.]|nr:MAG: NAD-dependent formate dehydrogenase alpha subunit [uncultured Caballeronia sp.]
MAIANLAMATGNVGREGVGMNPLRGQNNVQGSCDMGSFPHELPGLSSYQRRGIARVVRRRMVERQAAIGAGPAYRTCSMPPFTAASLASTARARTSFNPI